MNIDQVRSETHGCEVVIHFNNAGSALMPHTVINCLTYEELHGAFEAAELKQSC
ncbi:hypothetical protein SAMN05216464_103282 [Mucilaginibacter pineti]|uniref:Uncharacterized protein n=1 Tax=Mucilaginibacter pineti TaxID=1391627 RepID=A0A1G6ZB35_9SPHI|nr:hypothetical protein SAMN05216464_103282 [Mucilaginibacter pineti]